MLTGHRDKAEIVRSIGAADLPAHPPTEFVYRQFEAPERDTQPAMVNLRRCQNGSVPVNRLPPELLRMVFSRLRPPPSLRRASEDPVPLIALPSYKPLVTAMLVCHKWCAIASDAASLWTDIDFQWQRSFAPILLTRSSGAAIHLCGYLSRKDNTLETAIKNNAGRFRELDLWVEETGHVSALESVFAASMPQLRVLCLVCDKPKNTGIATLLASPLPSFPSLKALLLHGFFFVPTLLLSQLTHLYLGRIDQIDASTILDFLRNTPALESLDIIRSNLTSAFNSTTISSPITLPHLQSARIFGPTSTVVHYLMTALEVPGLAFLKLSGISVSGQTLLSTPLLPRALATHAMRRLTFDVHGDLSTFYTTLHGSDVYLGIGLNALALPYAEWTQRACTDFPTMLPLSGIEEFHLTSGRWQALRDVLPHLAMRIPAVSTLLIKHDPTEHSEILEDDGLVALAWTLARVLESDSPVLLPRLTHLEFIVHRIPLVFCEFLAPALKRRDEAGPRLRKLRIRVDDKHLLRWKLTLEGMDGVRESDYRRTGIFDHVDVCEILDGFVEDDGDLQRLGWGRWKDCAERPRHEYWRL